MARCDVNVCRSIIGDQVLVGHAPAQEDLVAHLCFLQDGEQQIVLAAIPEQDQAQAVIFLGCFHESAEQNIHAIIGFPTAQAEQHAPVAPAVAFAPNRAADAG